MSGLILSIAFCFHDSNITISNSDEVLLSLEAERIFRRKHVRLESPHEMDALIAEGLSYLGADAQDIEKVYLAKLNNKYDDDFKILGQRKNVTYTGHHNNHIGTSFPSGFEKCVIVVADGGSEDGTTKIYYKYGDTINFVEDLDHTPMTGKFYGTITQIIIDPKCSKAHNSYAGKLMGMSALGEYNDHYEKLILANKDEINKLHFSGCSHLNNIFGISENYHEPWLDQSRIDLARTADTFWVNTFADHLKGHAHFSENICLVGGCALNINLNSQLIDMITPLSRFSMRNMQANLLH